MCLTLLRCFLNWTASVCRNQLCRSKVYCRTAADRQGELHDLLDKLMDKAQKLNDSSVCLYYFRFVVFNAEPHTPHFFGWTLGSWRPAGRRKGPLIQTENWSYGSCLREFAADVVLSYSASLYVVKVLRGAPPAETREAPTADGAAASDVCLHAPTLVTVGFHLSGTSLLWEEGLLCSDQWTLCKNQEENLNQRSQNKSVLYFWHWVQVCSRSAPFFPQVRDCPG